ncbi:MAG: 4-hydroxy-tetrahydrodipicolinate synthase [Bacillota bacterium]
MYKPTGSWVAIPTPFNGDDSVDYEGFKTLIDFQASNGTSCLLVLGSAGETTLLSMEEKKSIIGEVARYSKGKIPVFFGTTCPSTRETTLLSQFAEAEGADGVVLTVPPYLLPPQDAVLDHFLTVGKSVNIPFGLYNNPTRTGVNIEPETIAAIYRQCPNFVADKEAMPRVSQLVEVLKLTGGNVHVLCCDFPKYSIVIPTLALGGHGTANIGGNIIPREMAEMSRPWTGFDQVEKSKALYFKYYPLLKALYTLSNPIVIKAALKLMGLPGGSPRRPYPEYQGPKLEELKALMTELGILK